MTDGVLIAVVGTVSTVITVLVGPTVQKILGRESLAVTTMREVAEELRKEKSRVDGENDGLRSRLATAEERITDQGATITRLMGEIEELRRQLDRHVCPPITQGDLI